MVILVPLDGTLLPRSKRRGRKWNDKGDGSRIRRTVCGQSGVEMSHVSDFDGLTRLPP